MIAALLIFTLHGVKMDYPTCNAMVDVLNLIDTTDSVAYPNSPRVFPEAIKQFQTDCLKHKN